MLLNKTFERINQKNQKKQLDHEYLQSLCQPA